jgi:hypothetical protein
VQNENSAVATPECMQAAGAGITAQPQRACRLQRQAVGTPAAGACSMTMLLRHQRRAGPHMDVCDTYKASTAPSSQNLTPRAHAATHKAACYPGKTEWLLGCWQRQRSTRGQGCMDSKHSGSLFKPTQMCNSWQVLTDQRQPSVAMGCRGGM